MGGIDNYTQVAYDMRAIFIELVPFAKWREDYLDEEQYHAFQKALLSDPESGDLIKGTGGLRKVRHADEDRNKGKSGSFRVIYYWWKKNAEIWLFTIYGKGDKDNLTDSEKSLLKKRLNEEIKKREAFLKVLQEKAKQERKR